MAGGRNGSFGGGSRSVQSTKKITKAMELIAASRIVKAQQRVRRGPALQRADHRGDPQPGRGRCRRRPPAAGASATRSAPSPSSSSPPTAAWPAATTPRSSGPPSGRCPPTRAEGRQTRLVTVGKKAVGLLPLPRLHDRADASRASPTSPTYEDAREIAERRDRGVRRAARSTRSSSSTPSSSRRRRSGWSCRRVPAARARGDAPSRPGATARRPTTSSSRRPRTSSTDLLPRYAEARLFAALLDACGVGARRPAAGHEVGHRQRRRADQDAQPGHEPGPPGRHHHRDHGDRRRRRGAAQPPRPAASDLLVDHALDVRRRPDRPPRPSHATSAHQEHPDDRSPRPPPTAASATLKDGRVVAIAGPVVDVEFPPDAAARDQHRPRDDHRPSTATTIVVRAEVAQQIGDSRVRAICLKPTDGLTRGTAVRNIGHGITVPVGDGVLGHVFNVIGEPLDVARARSDEDRRPLGHPPPRPRLRHPRAEAASCSRPASRSSTCSPPTCRAARSACSAAPASARPCSSTR